MFLLKLCQVKNRALEGANWSAEFSTTPDVNYRKLRNIKENDVLLLKTVRFHGARARVKSRGVHGTTRLFIEKMYEDRTMGEQGGSRVTLSRKVAVEEDL